jgi:hypothetical protein
MTTTANIRSGHGDANVASDLYASAILCEAATMRREGVYVCLANLQQRMPDYHQDMLSNTFWGLARSGRL